MAEVEIVNLRVEAAPSPQCEFARAFFSLTGSSHMLPLRLLRSTLSGVIVAATLGACALSPGMRFQATTPVDPTDPRSLPEVQQITPSLVRAQKNARDALDEGAKELVGSAQPYRIGPSDVLSIIVWDHPELVVPNLTYTIGETAGQLPGGPGLSTQAIPGFVVGEDGNLQYPYIGQVKAAGLTASELQRRLKQALAPYLRQPQLTVSVVAYRSQRVFVEGQVSQPGVKPITNIPMSLAEALSEANGVTAGVGDTSRIELLRNRESILLNLPALARNGINASQIMLQDRDVIRVPPQTYNQVLVTGEVTRPLALPLHDGRLTLSEALGAALGVNQTSSEPAAIYVIRASDDPAKPEVFHLDSASPVGLALAEHFDLHPKDVVYVDATGLARWSRVMNLLLPSAQGINVGRQVWGGY
ncbi:polysaccharide biosynthesis/export family protein [Paraburkholderia tropica]|uniref:polysaccharide biosynthesis/export family protein n=1 Tax=Paraburkholderia tropica TaxID=92647 RepID=UPI0031DAB1BE